MSSFTGAAVQGGRGLSCPDGSGGAVETSNFGDDEAAIAGGLAACLTSRLIGQCQPGHRHVRESLRGVNPFCWRTWGAGRLREGFRENQVGQARNRPKRIPVAPRTPVLPTSAIARACWRFWLFVAPLGHP